MNKETITALRPLLTLAGIGIAVILGLLIAGQGPFVRSHDLSGSLTLKDPSFAPLKAGNACQGSGGYDDIVLGAPVKASKSDGSTLALSKLQDGKIDKYGDCTFNFVINKLPKESFYTFTVGNRGGVDYSYSDLEKQNFRIEVTLGQ